MHVACRQYDIDCVFSCRQVQIFFSKNQSFLLRIVALKFVATSASNAVPKVALICTTNKNTKYFTNYPQPSGCLIILQILTDFRRTFKILYFAFLPPERSQATQISGLWGRGRGGGGWRGIGS